MATPQENKPLFKDVPSILLNSGESTEKCYFSFKKTARAAIFYVPGTTDPVNANEKNSGDASVVYWSENPKLKQAVSNLQHEYEISDIYDTFRWSGDNNIEARQKAGRELADFINKMNTDSPAPFDVHLICHSHGGNVIHEFTNSTADDSRFENVKIKSIVYLSVPFFRNQAQIKSTLLAPDCKLINVYNDFDLTQQFVANFSMFQMPKLISSFEENKSMAAATENLSEISKLLIGADFLSMALSERFGLGALNDITGRDMWKQLLEVFKSLDTIFSEILFTFKTLNDEANEIRESNNSSGTDKFEFITNSIFNKLDNVIRVQLLVDIKSVEANLQNRLDNSKWFTNDYNVDTLKQDIGKPLKSIIIKINDFIELEDTGNVSVLLSPLMRIIDEILLNQIDTFDDTVKSPYRQKETWDLKDLITEIDVTRKDPYNSCGERFDCHRWIQKLEKLEEEYEGVAADSNVGTEKRSEILAQLIAQTNYDVILGSLGIITVIGTMLTWGELDNLIRITTDNLKIYKSRLDGLNFNITSKQDLDAGKSHMEQRGSVGYLAVVSHSISRQNLYPKVKDAWVEAFSTKGQQDTFTLCIGTK